MGTIHPPFQQVYYPLYDSSQPYELNMQLMAQDPSDMNLYGPTAQTHQDPSDMNLYGPTAQTHWEQWCSIEDAILSESTNAAGPNLYPQAQQAYCHFTYGPDVSTQWASPSNEFASVESPTENSEICRDSTSTQTDKRRRNMSQTTASKALRRTPTHRNPKLEMTKESFTEPKELNEYDKQVNNRSRIASHKFRIKQREDAKRLDADMKEI